MAIRPTIVRADFRSAFSSSQFSRWGDEAPVPPSAVADSEPVSESRDPVPSPQVELQDLDLPEDLDESGAVGLALQRQQRDETIWRTEVLAQTYERALVRLGDALLVQQRQPNGNPFQVLAQQPLRQITVGIPAEAESIRWGATVATLSEQPTPLSADEWRLRVEAFREAGYQIVQTEWHHAAFDPPVDGPARSRVTMAIYVVHPDRNARFVLAGDLHIVWQADYNTVGVPLPDTIDATEVKLYQRTGDIDADGDLDLWIGQ